MWDPNDNTYPCRIMLLVCREACLTAYVLPFTKQVKWCCLWLHIKPLQIMIVDEVDVVLPQKYEFYILSQILSVVLLRDWKDNVFVKSQLSYSVLLELYNYLHCKYWIAKNFGRGREEKIPMTLSKFYPPNTSSIWKAKCWTWICWSYFCQIIYVI